MDPSMQFAPSGARHARDPVSGYSHLAGLMLAVVGVSVLVARGIGSTGMLVSTSVYGACLVALYGASSAYHLAPSDVAQDSARIRGLRKLDHAAIFAMIAGTCTPVFWRAFDGPRRVAMIAVIWGLAALGILLRLVWMHAPRWLYTIMYVAMGWLFAVQAPRGFAALPGPILALVVAGGVTYTLGALVYALKRPNPFPRVFGFHEIWHVFVLGGSVLHYAAILGLATST